MIDIEPSKVQSWAFTVKKLGSVKLFKSDYDFVLNIFSKHGNVTDHCYELDKLGIMHIHGIIELPKNFHRKRLCINGYHVKIKEVYDYLGWVEYLSKDQPKKQLPSETLKDLFSGDTKILD